MLTDAADEPGWPEPFEDRHTGIEADDRDAPLVLLQRVLQQVSLQPSDRPIVLLELAASELKEGLVDHDEQVFAEPALLCCCCFLFLMLCVVVVVVVVVVVGLVVGVLLLLLSPTPG